MKKVILELPDEVKSLSITFLTISPQNLGMSHTMIGLADGEPEVSFAMKRGMDSDGRLVYGIAKKDEKTVETDNKEA